MGIRKGGREGDREREHNIIARWPDNYYDSGGNYINHAGVSNTFTFSPNSIVLQSDETTATVSITVIDDLLPENDLSSTISADSVAGSEQISIIILDNDCECV